MFKKSNIGGLVAAICVAVAASCAGSEFVVPGTNALERLEVEEGYAAGRVVVVPLKRKPDMPAAEEMLSAGGRDYLVSWEAGETRKYVEVAVPTGLKGGDEVLLELHSEGGGAPQTSRIAVVAPVPNGLANPWWIGERDAEALGWGEWTMDIAAATGKVAATEGDAYTLVYFSGLLWCPWCQGLEKGLLGTDAFKAWCVERKVALVVLDNPRRSTTDHISGDPPYVISTVPDGNPPVLLRYDSGRNSVIDKMVSGASYLSRKGISVQDAEAKLQENHTLGYKGGAFVTPESWRLSYPSMMLLRKDGTVAGRLNRYAPTPTSCDTDENMARLDDFLKLAHTDGLADNYVTTTTRSLKCGERADGCVFQINDTTEAFRLDFIPNGIVKFNVTGKTADRPVKLSVVRLDNEDQKVLVSGTDAVTCDFSGVEAGAMFLKLTAFEETAKYGKDTTFSLSVESSVSSAAGGEADCATVLYTGFEQTVNLSTNACSVPASGSAKIKILSGKMPSGVKLVYDQASKKIVLSGTAKKAGEYHVEYAFEGALDEAASLTFSVKDPAVENPNLSGPRAMTLPLMRQREDGKREMCGVLALSIKANSSLTAKYACTASGKTISFRGRWSSMVGGTATAELVSRSGERLMLDLAANGQIEARIHDARYLDGLDSGVLRVKAGDSLAMFGGTYTVALPATDGGTGTGYLTLSIGGTDGKVKWKGMLANGQSVGGAAYLSKNSDGLGIVPVFRATSKCYVSALLAVRPGARNAFTRRAVRLADGTVAVWAAGGGTHDCKAWGSWFEDVNSFAELCLDCALPTNLLLWFGDGAQTVASSLPSASVVASDSEIALSQRGAALRLSCRKKNGVFKGSAKFALGGRSVTVKYAGVIIPGWYDCGCEIPDPEDLFNIADSMPFAIGTAFYPDRSCEDSGKRSLVVKMGVEE